MATKQDIKNMATKQDIKNMATKQDIKNMATKQDIKDMATKQDIQRLETDNKELRGDFNRMWTLMLEIKDIVGALYDKVETFASKVNVQERMLDSHDNKIETLDVRVKVLERFR